MRSGKNQGDLDEMKGMSLTSCCGEELAKI